eukprot:Nitzschia sp. Nitz4//scaffold137_size62074//10514//11812//NITZ4_006407-RA/size62074-processed-gene-0.80-mRNA-1//-1//CDS//3329535676//7236//frame0
MRVFVLAVLLISCALAQAEVGNGVTLSTTLANKAEIPLVGLDLDQIKDSDVESLVKDGFLGEGSIRLFDTSHVSGGEHEVAKGIVAAVKELSESQVLDKPVEVHVVTKVWYTYLGYERTRMSVQESLRELEPAISDPKIDLKVHMMLHWPRCYQGIEWMQCELEEENLPAAVKAAGPAPHLNKKDAWKGSWKALEDMYGSKAAFPNIASIGVANFKNGDLKTLMETSRIQPHLVQLNVWSLLNDPQTVNLCHHYQSAVQVFDVMNGIIARAATTPHANGFLRKVAHEIASGAEPVTTDEVIFKWLTEFGISTVQDDPSLSLEGIQDLSESNQKVVASAVEAILTSNDLEDDVHVKVTFHAVDEDMVLFYYPGPTAEDEMMIKYIKKGSSYVESTHPRHTFRMYSAVDPHVYYDHMVEGYYGDTQDVRVELSR